jgi:NAD(P)-dependent dehydrogenase (short-subunit alcohol dehydrogenase family)
LGLETTRALTNAGAQVIVPARRPEHATEVLAAEGLGGVEVGPLDLGDLDSVPAYAESLLATGRPIAI